MKRTLIDYRRDVYKHIIAESVLTVYMTACEVKDGDLNESAIASVRNAIIESFDPNNNKTIREMVLETKGKTYLLEEVAKVAEEIANDKADTVQEEKLPIPDDVCLNDEEKELILDILQKTETDEIISDIRDSVSNALTTEAQKAQEVEDSIDMMRDRGYDEEKIQESVSMSAARPSSLMNSLINFMTHQIISECATDGNINFKDIISENAENIKNRASLVYAIYETVSKVGLKTYSAKELEAASYKYHNNKLNENNNDPKNDPVYREIQEKIERLGKERAELWEKKRDLNKQRDRLEYGKNPMTEEEKKKLSELEAESRPISEKIHELDDEIDKEVVRRKEWHDANSNH